MESHYRSIVKAITWRACATVVTITVAWACLREIDQALTIGVLDTLIKIGVFYSHERLWLRLNFGRSKPPEYQI